MCATHSCSPGWGAPCTERFVFDRSTMQVALGFRYAFAQLQIVHPLDHLISITLEGSRLQTVHVLKGLRQRVVAKPVSVWKTDIDSCYTQHRTLKAKWHHSQQKLLPKLLRNHYQIERNGMCFRLNSRRDIFLFAHSLCACLFVSATRRYAFFDRIHTSMPRVFGQNTCVTPLEFPNY